MNRVMTCALAVALATPVLAQNALLPTISVVPQTWSTGMVGFPATQTVRLNVLNNSSVPANSTLPSPNCALQLSFYDAQGKLLKQTTVGSLAPGVATGLELGRGEISGVPASTLRVQVRGVVQTILAPASGGGSSTPMVLSACSPFITVEVYDNATGASQVLTSDARLMSSGIIPLLITGKGANGGDDK
jgi:hypothetical protein